MLDPFLVEGINVGSQLGQCQEKNDLKASSQRQSELKCHICFVHLGDFARPSNKKSTPISRNFGRRLSYNNSVATLEICSSGQHIISCVRLADFPKERGAAWSSHKTYEAPLDHSVPHGTVAEKHLRSLFSGLLPKALLEMQTSHANTG